VEFNNNKNKPEQNHSHGSTTFILSVIATHLP